MKQLKSDLECGNLASLFTFFLFLAEVNDMGGSSDFEHIWLKSISQMVQ